MVLVPFLVCALCLYMAGKCLYNLHLHPLRDYPGPWLCRASCLPRLWHRLAGTNIGHAHRLHEAYGRVVRLSPRELSYIATDAWDDIYARHGGNAALPKEPTFNAAAPGLPRGIVQALDGAAHARQRRIFAPAFSTTALKQQEALIGGHVQKLVGHLQRACCGGGAESSSSSSSTAEVNVADAFNFLAFDVMADLAFGRPLGLLDAGAYTPWARNVLAVFALLALRAALLLYVPGAGLLPLPLSRALAWALTSRRTQAARDAHMAYAAGLVDARLDAEGEGRGRADIWTLVERRQDALTRREMHVNAAIFMAAGTETTATALCGAAWFLARHRGKMARVAAEVRELAAAGGGELGMEAMARLPYLNAVVSEAMRLYPPTPDMLYRLVPADGAVICGKHVPAGAVVGIHQWPAYHSALNFHRPEEFIPERWLPGASAGEFANDQRKIVQPFSKGPRSCIGKNLALHEIRFTLARILLQFELSAGEEAGAWMQQKSRIVWVKPPLILKVKSLV